jgi:hypothetical protein
VNEYEIGTSSGAMTNLRDLPVSFAGHEPVGRMAEWSEAYFKGDGLKAGDGFPVAIWKFPMLTQEMVNQLREFCPSPAASANVYIRTDKPDGTWASFSAVMDWPDDQMDRRQWGGRYWDIEFTFRMLEAL